MEEPEVKLKLEVTLKQHTPMLHFQHKEKRATIRATEMKPMLDRFLLLKLEKGKIEAYKKKWLCADGQQENALNYKLRIEANSEFSLKIPDKRDRKGNSIKPQKGGKYNLADFPSVLSNMGGKKNPNELINFSYHKGVTVSFFSLKEDLISHIENHICEFFALYNFGQRKTKGFGSFLVTHIDKKEKGPFKFSDYYTYYMSFKINSEDSLYDRQNCIFSVIDYYWKVLKSGINYTRRKEDRNGGVRRIKCSQRSCITEEDTYIKSYLWKYLNLKNIGTWEKRKIKIELNMVSVPPNNEKKNSDEIFDKSYFARALLGLPDHFEYKVMKGTFDEPRGKRTEDHDRFAVAIKNDTIKRIPSPITFKPIIEGNNVMVFIKIDTEVIDKIKEVIEKKGEAKNFKLTRTCNKKHDHTSDCSKEFKTNIVINPNLFKISELIDSYHLENKMLNPINYRQQYIIPCDDYQVKLCKYERKE